MMLIAFHMIQVKGCPLQVIMLMIKMLLGEHTFLEGHSSLMLMSYHANIFKRLIMLLSSCVPNFEAIFMIPC
jgi:hypothetical protein